MSPSRLAANPDPQLTPLDLARVALVEHHPLGQAVRPGQALGPLQDDGVALDGANPPGPGPAQRKARRPIPVPRSTTTSPWVTVSWIVRRNWPTRLAS